MRFVPWALAAGAVVACAGCGLDATGLLPDDGGGSGTDASSFPDVTVTGGGDSGGSDGLAPTRDGTVTAESGGGTDGASDGSVGPDDASDGNAASETGSDANAALDAGVDAPANGADAGHDSGPPEDAGVDACGSVEICNNGVDDNCDGLIDCADPQCGAGWSCTSATVPPGWTVVEYAQNTRPTCAGDFATSVDVIEGPTGAPATCGCGCTVATPGSCETGNFPVNVSLTGGPACLINSATSPGNQGACSPVATKFSAFTGFEMEISPLGYTAGTCTPQPAVSTTDAGVLFQGRVCKDTQSTGAGCPNAGACVPAAQSGTSICILHSGQVACPAGFTANPHAVGTALAEGRGCTACGCTPSGSCSNAEVTFFTATDCNDAGAQAVAANGACSDFPGPGAPTYVSYEYTAQLTEACNGSPVFADGGVTLTEPRTVCCE